MDPTQISGLGMIQDATSGLVWLEDISLGVASPMDEDDARFVVHFHGEGIVSDDKIAVTAVIGDLNVVSSTGLHMLGVLLSEENMMKIREQVIAMARDQMNAGELPMLVEEFHSELFPGVPKDKVHTQYYNRSRLEED